MPVAQIALPALGTLYFALSKIWGFPYGQEIVGTITAVDAFLEGKIKDTYIVIDPLFAECEFSREAWNTRK